MGPFLGFHNVELGYLNRINVKRKRWDEYEEYDPPYIDTGNQLDGCDPVNPSDVNFHSKMQGTPFEIDDYNYPLNPKGRTGMQGRFGLYFWGPNRVINPILMIKTGEYRLMLVMSKNGKVRIQELFVSPFDTSEDLMSFFFIMFGDQSEKQDQNQFEIFNGLKEHDPRNTDNSWIETSVVCAEITNNTSECLSATLDEDYSLIPLNESTLLLFDTTEEEWVRASIAKVIR